MIPYMFWSQAEGLSSWDYLPLKLSTIIGFGFALGLKGLSRILTLNIITFNFGSRSCSRTRVHQNSGQAKHSKGEVWLKPHVSHSLHSLKGELYRRFYRGPL